MEKGPLFSWTQGPWSAQALLCELSSASVWEVPDYGGIWLHKWIIMEIDYMKGLT